VRPAAARFLALITLVACETGGPPDMTAPPRAPVAPVAPAPPGPAAAPVAATIDCPIAVSIEVTGSGPQRTLVVTAENRTSSPQEVVLPDRCPAGPIEFSGLPAGYDYYGTCAMGACPGPRPDARIGLGAGERRELGRTTINVEAATCNAALPAGEYGITVSLPGVDSSCITGAPLLVGAPDQPRSPQPPVRKAPPAKPAPKPDPDPEPASKPAAGADFYACTADSDCIVHCPRAQGCCGWACGCKNAINKAHKAAFDAHHARTCQKAPDCPAMGCAYEPHHSARCVNNRCRSFEGIGL
jgi:hypothetical protein